MRPKQLPENRGMRRHGKGSGSPPQMWRSEPVLATRPMADRSDGERPEPAPLPDEPDQWNVSPSLLRIPAHARTAPLWFPRSGDEKPFARYFVARGRAPSPLRPAPETSSYALK